LPSLTARASNGGNRKPRGAYVVDDYAARVVAGKVPAGKYHRLACVRHLRDRTREGTRAFPYVFSVAHAERFFAFAQQMRHYKGKWAGTLVELSPVQKFRLGSIFGWVHQTTGVRRFRDAYNELPRKQGKSLEAAIVALYVTFFCGEAGAEGYCIATKRDQAKIVFDCCVKLVRSSGLGTRIRAMVNNLSREATASKLEPLGADFDSTDGLNPNLIVTDEFHAHKNRGLIDVMETALGAREEPLHFQITTAGDDPVSPCGDQHDYACKILDRVLTDESFFAFIAHADPKDDPFLPATWKKANPHYGISVNPADLRAVARKAQHMPAAAAAFKQKRLNLWVSALAPWLSLEGWRKGQPGTPIDTLVRLAALEHEPCFAGVDLSSKLDLTALVLVFPPTIGRAAWELVRWVWTPEATLKDRARRDRAPYDVWVKAGHLLTTPGSTIDTRVIRETLTMVRPLVDLQQIGFDPWHGHDIMRDLVEEDGFGEDQIVEVPQTFAHLSSASKTFEAAVIEGRVDAGGCPLMLWCASNAVVQRDGKDNILPTKKRSRGRIDPIMASLNAVSLAERSTPEHAAEDPDLVTA
jgi:phage terminase large subunit-like protein